MLIASVAPVTADGTSGVSSSGSGSSYLYISSVTMNPEVFYPYEQGTVTVTLTNDGNTSIGVTHPNILSASDAITIVNEDKWKTVSYIASGNSICYTFVVTVNGFDGRYFGLFTIETMNSQGAYSQNVHYPLTLDVNSKDLTPAISKKPETFTLDSDASVNLSLINPRDGAIDDIVITTEGTGMDITPTQTFVRLPHRGQCHGDTVHDQPAQGDQCHVQYQLQERRYGTTRLRSAARQPWDR